MWESWNLWSETFRFAICVEHEVCSPFLSTDCTTEVYRPLKTLHISDTHMDTNFELQWVSLICSSTPTKVDTPLIKSIVSNSQSVWEPDYGSSVSRQSLDCTFSGFSAGFCINEEKGYLLPTLAWKITLPMFQLNAPVVITFALMMTGAFSRNVGKVIFRTQVGNILFI